MKLRRELVNSKQRSKGYRPLCKQCYNKHRRLVWRRYAGLVRKAILKYLQKHPCVDCGETNPIALEFHHLKNKKYNIAPLIGKGCKLSRIMSEIAKCDVVCANCHKKRTAKQQNWYNMKTKKCCNCKEIKSVKLFNKRGTGYNSWCKKCCNKYHKKYYSNTRAIHYEITTRRRIVLRQKLLEYLKEHPCVDCGESNPITLEFHHLKNKKYNIANIIKYVSSWDTVLKEIAKCDIVCSNCHKKRTAKQQNWYSKSRKVG